MEKDDDDDEDEIGSLKDFIDDGNFPQGYCTNSVIEKNRYPPWSRCHLIQLNADLVTCKIVNNLDLVNIFLVNFFGVTKKLTKSRFYCTVFAIIKKSFDKKRSLWDTKHLKNAVF